MLCGGLASNVPSNKSSTTWLGSQKLQFRNTVSPVKNSSSSYSSFQRLVTFHAGETRGDGYMNMMFPVHEQLALSVSVGKTFDPKTAQGWQNKGIDVNHKVPAEGALGFALELATEP